MTRGIVLWSSIGPSSTNKVATKIRARDVLEVRQPVTLVHV
jgi:hypothetical protein